MCTLILGLGVLGAGSLVLGANRDERPERPADPPGVLNASPRVVGGRDLAAGGTWLAVRERRAVVALLNRRPASADLARTWPRSRGRLTLDVATVPEDDDAGDLVLPIEVPDGLPRAALARAWAGVTREAYAPFSLVFAAPGCAWMVARAPGGAPFARRIDPGWHVLTHTELDDPDEPRAAWLLAGIAALAPRDPDEAEAALATRLAAHADGHPAVCLHAGGMVTRSASRVTLAPGVARYTHVEGRPCERAFADLGGLFAGEPPGPARDV